MQTSYSIEAFDIELCFYFREMNTISTCYILFKHFVKLIFRESALGNHNTTIAVIV